LSADRETPASPTTNPDDDDRHFLYRHYLGVLHNRRPDVFVLENVKGVLSSAVSRRFDLPEDARGPFRTFARACVVPRKRSVGYRIVAAATSTSFEPGTSPRKIDPKDFVVKGENHGLAQARHRVILIGIRDDIGGSDAPTIQHFPSHTVAEMIGDLPRVRSGLSRQEMTSEAG
jgi:DNA (cytosine-5)-methyltransferase 1